MDISKEEKKKKAHRKRDRFWKLIFPHYKPNTEISSTKYKNNSKGSITKKTQEQLNKISALSNYAQRNISVTLGPEVFESILESNDWDAKKAMLDLNDYEEASHGILAEPPTFDKVLLGSENDGGTSCYIDALLFAMFISNTAFDPLLTYDIPTTEEEEDKIKLQTLMRLFVNKLRKGHFICADYVHWFRKVLQDAKWNGQNEQGQWTQEDSSELFMFITETFDLPYLPFQIRLFHGANKDSDDDRVMTDRTLTLSIPDDDKSNQELQLQDILVDYFYNSIITGVRRQVDYQEQHLIEQDISENVPASPSFISSFEEHTNEKDTLKQLLKRARSNSLKMNPQEQEEEIAVTAWQVLELLPFYSATNEQGEAIQTQTDSSFPDTRMILPIVLKRYRYDHLGGSSKIKRRIDIPVTIDFNKFVNQNVDDPLCPTCGHLVDWTLHFKSAVCHKGDSPFSGHYISYARVKKQDKDLEPTKNAEDDNDYYWLKLDDMNSSNHVTQISNNNSGSVHTDLAENAYIIFYELDKTCHHRRHSISITYSTDNVSEAEEGEERESEDDGIEIKEDIKSLGSTSTHETGKEDQDCNCDKSQKKSDKHRHHSHHHHHRYHLKDSCRLM